MASKLINSKADFEQWRKKYKDRSNVGGDISSMSQSSEDKHSDPSSNNEIDT